MKTITAGLANWKTSFLGALLAGGIVAQTYLDNGLTLDNPKVWLAVVIAALSFVMRDADKSSQDSGIRK